MNTWTDIVLDESERKKHTPSGCGTRSTGTYLEIFTLLKGEIGTGMDSAIRLRPTPEVRTMEGNFIENKGFSTVINMRRGSTIRFGHASAARDPNPNKERNFVTHVEADESASDPGTAGGAGAASDHVYPEHASINHVQ